MYFNLKIQVVFELFFKYTYNFYLIMFLGKNIKYLRKVKKLTQKDIADVLEVTHQMVSHYESGSTSPQVDVVQKIANFLGVELKDLMFTNLETGEKAEGRVVEKDRVTRLLEKELDRLEALEGKIKANKQIMDQIRKIDPDLAKDIEQT